MPFPPTPPLPAGAPAGPLVDPTLIEDYSPPELKIEPRSPPLVLSENTNVTNDVLDITVNYKNKKSICEKTLASSKSKGWNSPSI